MKNFISAELNLQVEGTRANAIREAIQILTERAKNGFYGRFAFRATDDSGFVISVGSGTAKLAHKWNASRYA